MTIAKDSRAFFKLLNCGCQSGKLKSRGLPFTKVGEARLHRSRRRLYLSGGVCHPFKRLSLGLIDPFIWHGLSVFKAIEQLRNVAPANRFLSGVDAI
jgi:hypothetical protein